VLDHSPTSVEAGGDPTSLPGKITAIIIIISIIIIIVIVIVIIIVNIIQHNPTSSNIPIRQVSRVFSSFPLLRRDLASSRAASKSSPAGGVASTIPHGAFGRNIWQQPRMSNGRAQAQVKQRCKSTRFPTDLPFLLENV
jgi:hypothetical protein